MQFTFLSAGKAFTDPLMLLLVVAGIAAMVAFARARRDGHPRTAIAISLAAIFGIAILSMPVTPLMIDRALRPDAASPAFVPQYIVVPSGGYRRGSDDATTVMTSDTAIRVVGAIEWWRAVPGAKLVFTGGDTVVGGTMPTTVELMRDEALRRGVPPDALILEARSRNTREHAVQLSARLPRDARIGIATAGWHLRRAEAAFRRHFTNVEGRAVDSGTDETLVGNHFLPSSSAMRMTTILLHEYVGMAWYALRS